jgi:hypothetical protein
MVLLLAKRAQAWPALLVLLFVGSAMAADDPPAKPPDVVIAPAAGTSVEWSGLTRSSLRFLGVMHAFRYVTEPGTRAGGIGLGSGYTSSVANLHGWADGDPFYVNYVGHPMQGAVWTSLWLRYDPRYRQAEFGRSAAYWKGRLRSAAFAWAMSEQFEIGPLSEASVGHIQRDYPQWGLVDHVITPVVGLGWRVAEDALDRYIVERVEARTRNGFARILSRIALNPALSFANVMDLKVPWYRDSRRGVFVYGAPGEVVRRERTALPPDVPAGNSVLDIAASAGVRQIGGKPCAGGGGEAAVRLATEWQLVLALNGCKMTNQAENISGDALIYQVGPRWTPATNGKWSPFAHLLVGGLKMTQETLDPAEKERVLESHKDLDPMLAYTLHSKYTTQAESNRLALTAGMGVDYRLNPAVAIRVASLEYLHGGAGVVSGNGFQMTTGMVLRWGTW